MKKTALWLVVMATLAMAGESVGQEAGIRAPAISARRELNCIRVNGQPTVLLWARGVAAEGDLDEYAASGFNTVYVLIRDDGEDALAALDTFITAAEARGLLVVGALAPSSLGGVGGTGLPIDASSPAYAEAVTDFVGGVVARLGDHPSLIGWSVEAVPPRLVAQTDLGFRAYLQSWHGSLTAVNRAWGTAFTDWGQVRLAGIRDVDSLRPAGLGRASIDLALYRQASYAEALSLWATALRGASPGRLLLAANLPDYRSIISVRPDFDGLVIDTLPSTAEPDWETHNVHAVDIARRANRFAAVQTLAVGSRSEVGQVAAWINAALLHGAAGIALSDWQSIRDSDPIKGVVRQTAEAIGATGAFPAQPAPRAAILYQPIAGGALRDGRGLYGYLDGMTPNEPTGLFRIVRNGSRFGQFDVLSLDRVSEVDLSDYGVIIAPMALYLPEDIQVALHAFVLRGGALVTDAGIGMYQAEGTATSVPEVMRDLLGIRYVDLAQPPPLQYPGGGTVFSPGFAPDTGISIPIGPGDVASPIDPDVEWLAAFIEELMGEPEVAKYLGQSFTGENSPRLRVRGLGRGFAVYAPTFLYQNWSPNDPYFAEFHARVLANGRDLEVVTPSGLWPGVAAAGYSDGSIAVASPAGVAASVIAYGAANRLYAIPGGAVRVANPDEEARIEILFPREALSVARPLPIWVGTTEAGAVATVSVSWYGPDRVELIVNGTGASATFGRNGLTIRGGARTAIQILVQDGSYAVKAESVHRVTLTEATRRQRQWQEDFAPNPDTGALAIPVLTAGGRIVIEPAPEE